jgi:glycosyltransferase involved in cell wall biosynthesis
MSIKRALENSVGPLAEGRGLLVNSKEPAAMSAAVLRLANNPQERQTLAEKAYALGRQMGWSNVSKQYLKTFTRVKLQSDYKKEE